MSILFTGTAGFIGMHAATRWLVRGAGAMGSPRDPISPIPQLLNHQIT